ncbi:MAG: Stp1/IreP family PP2C-type Ser/Thr phosphatase [Acidobacteriota bacterium]
MRVLAAGLTDKGLIRPHNEDALLVETPSGVFAVADGMGGHAAGEVASHLAIEAIGDSLRDRSQNGELSVPELLLQAVEEANQRIANRMEERPECRGMGTTVVVAVVNGGQFWVAHVGDSRAYLLRDGNLRQITTDHSFVNELVRLGMLSREQAARDPRRNVVTRALGSGTVVVPDIQQELLQPGDLVLLCSDGLNTMLGDKRISDLLAAPAGDLQSVCERLVAAANEAGGEDNITVVVLQASGDEGDGEATRPQ